MSQYDDKVSSPKPWSSASLPLSCQRPCDSYSNSIVYFHRDKAGLYDRAFLLRTLGNLAGYLCATLEILTPSELLSTEHNIDNQSISTSLSWYDFYNLSALPPSPPALPTKATNDSEEVQDKRRIVIEKTWLQINEGPLHRQESLSVAYVKTTRPEHAMHDLEHVEALSWNKSIPGDTSEHGSMHRFFWEIEVSWWYARKFLRNILDQRRSDDTWSDRYEMLPDFFGTDGSREQQHRQHQGRSNFQGCSYISMDAPHDMQQLVDNLWETQFPRSIIDDDEKRNDFWHSQNGIVGILHIRRGDTIKECDTSLEGMKSYIDCTFDGVFDEIGIGEANVTLLLASDEQDKEYREGVKKLLLKNTTRITSVIDADEMIWSYLLQELGQTDYRLNNYYAFRILDVLMSDSQRVHFVLERRRKRHCLECDHDKLLQSIDR